MTHRCVASCGAAILGVFAVIAGCEDAAAPRGAEDAGAPDVVSPGDDAGAVLPVDAGGADGAALPEGDGGCGLPPAGETTISVTSGGVLRTAVLFVPTPPAPLPSEGGKIRERGTTNGVPVVLLFHGSGGTSKDILDATGMRETAAKEGFVVVAPQAALRVGSDGPYWNIPGVPLTDGRPVPAGAPSDVELVGALLDAVEARFCVDPKRVYAAGFSGGARFTSTLACAMGDRIAAVATASGLRFAEPCARVVPVIAFHALDDATNPYDGGPPPPYWTYGVEEAARGWAQKGGCTGAAARTVLAGGIVETRWGRCVDLVVSPTGGHAWPGAAADPNERIWRFFATFAAPG